MMAGDDIAMNASEEDPSRTGSAIVEPPGAHPLATIALGLALLGLALPFVPAVGALVVAPIAKRRIAVPGSPYAGHGMATVAQLIAVLQLVALVLIFWAVATYF